jgi:hypothetical protein
MLAELGAQRREPLGDGGEPRLLFAIEARAGAAEVGVVALQHARLLGGEAGLVSLLPQGVDPADQGVVEADGVAVRGELRGHLPLDRLQGVVGMGPGKAEEDRRYLVERLAGALHGHDGVIERRRGRISGDGVDLGEVRLERFRERRDEVFRPDRLERRHPERRGPVGQQRVGMGRNGVRTGNAACGHKVPRTA